ncbi:HAD family hydrolase [Ammoniphilus sp. CFH 90114]|uniref:HAD family hydrolase n=1 Tax=Ammoniphilus sp. CFH 90114 TaxID=2493665 RepID=UPI00100FFAF9|nr:HAD family hydrolase [Ammoniphilus sp. CFH 90114]RXT14976.1 HAD family hydrolase [Ammoniphilus sp. CFH 90114]
MFIFDIDGTLLNSREEVLPNTALSLRKLRAEGHPIALCTGRTWACTKPVMKKVAPWVDYVICGNGSHIRTKQGDVLYDNNLPPYFIRRFIELVSGLADFLIATNHMVISTSYNTPYNDVEHCMHLFDHRQFHERIHAKNLLAFNLDHLCSRRRDTIRRELDSIDPLIKLSPHPDMWEVLSGLDNKATALCRLSQTTGIPLSEFTAFGDNYNDVDMFQVVGKAVAMGNSPDEVKAHAHYITRSNNEDGIYHYLKDYLR